MSRRPPPRKSRPGRAGKPRARRGASAETLDIEIERLGAQGDGLATWAGQTLYVPRALPG